MNLALFDFDGTITKQDTFTKFIFYATPKTRLIIAGLCLLPIILLYKLKLLPASKTRPLVAKAAFIGRCHKAVNQLAQQYVDEYIPGVLRQSAIAQIKWHQQQGDTIYLVSASLNPYLELWCKQMGLKLICSELEVKNGRYTGRYVQGDCSKHTKAKLIKQTIQLSDYQQIYAYGDTPEDQQMLALADIRFYRGKPTSNEDN